MFAFFSLGGQELLILLVLVVFGLMAAVSVTVVVTVALLGRKSEPKE